MKLVVLTNILTPYRIPLFEALRRRSDEFTVLLMAEREENRQWRLEQPRFNVQILPGWHFRPGRRQVSLHVNYGVIATLRRLSPDVVLSGGFAPANLWAFLYCKLFGKKFVGWGELTVRDRTAGPFLRRLLRRWLTKGSDGSIASSSDARDTFLHYGASEHRVLLSILPIEVEKFRQQTKAWKETEQCRVMRRRLEGPILLSVGRLTGSKGYLELFEIYQRLLLGRPRLSLVIVGDGPERSQYEHHVRQQGWEQVHFVGFVQASDLPKYLAVADLFVFHTLFDPFGAVLSEAMAAELPVVSSVYAGATRDLIEDGVTGFRIDPKKSESAAATISMVLDFPPQSLEALGRAAYDRMKASDIEPSADRIVRFLRWLVDAGVPRSVHVNRPIESRRG